jgi:hypothetical protein
MNSDVSEVRFKKIEEQIKALGKMKTEIKDLRQQVKEKEQRIQQLQDIEDIKRLQCAYGYYLEHWMGEEIMDCFSKSPEVSATLAEGTYYGPEGIKRYFGKSKTQPPEFLHQVMQLSPVITIESGGERAKGRWYGYGSISVPTKNGMIASYISAIYEMEYIKEDGVWKILTLALQMHYSCPAGGSWVRPEKLAPPGVKVDNIKMNPDKWVEFDIGYPSGYIYPFSFKHPVTGKVTSEGERNATLKMKPSPYLNWK